MIQISGVDLRGCVHCRVRRGSCRASWRAGFRQGQILLGHGTAQLGMWKYHLENLVKDPAPIGVKGAPGMVPYQAPRDRHERGSENPE